MSTDAALQEVCSQACQQVYVALDTEFVRVRTYYPQLGLIQLYDGISLSLIDPLTISDWQPFISLLQDNNVIKLLHAGSEDLEVFAHNFDTLPAPIIDTQVLAAFVGHPISSGFATIVREYLNIELDKSESRTDWLARPLSERQCQYAAADVYYLLPLANKLIMAVEKAGWLDAAKNECQILAQKRREILLPEQAYFEISHAWQLQSRQLACLQKLAEWRLQQARERDMAINFVVREENLWQVANHLPTTLSELNTLGISSPEIRFHGKTLLDFVAQTKALSESDLPPKIVRLVDHPYYKQAFKAVKTTVQDVASKSGLPIELLASRRQINQLLRVHWRQKDEQPSLLSGWRKMLLAQELEKVLGLFTDKNLT